jgi:hypothetical protein
VPTAREPSAVSVAEAAALTVAAGTARLLASYCTDSPVPEAADRRCEGVADLAARRAQVLQSLLFTDRYTAMFTEDSDDDAGGPVHLEQGELIFDGANTYIRVADSWTGFSLGDPGGPRGPNDPLWPLDALFGANDDVMKLGPEVVRGVPVTRCRFTIDLARADAALPAGVSVPAGPYRSLSRLPAEVWLDELGLARRICTNTDPTGPAGLQVWAVCELWDFGLAVDIAPPRPDEVLEPAAAYRNAGDGG